VKFFCCPPFLFLFPPSSPDLRGGIEEGGRKIKLARRFRLWSRYRHFFPFPHPGVISTRGIDLDRATRATCCLHPDSGGRRRSLLFFPPLFLLGREQPGEDYEALLAARSPGGLWTAPLLFFFVLPLSFAIEGGREI